MNLQAEIDSSAKNIVQEMLTLEPEKSFHIHFVDSDLMGIGVLKNKILPEEGSDIVVGVGSARIRHKIAFTLEWSKDNFSFVIDNKSDLETIKPDQTCLVLWDYLLLSQPLAASLVYRDWKSIHLIVVVSELTESTPGVSLKSLLVPQMPSH
jgi:hypothetical protein